MSTRLQVPRGLMRFFAEAPSFQREFVEIQHFFQKLASPTTGTVFKNVRIITSGSFTPDENIDEIWVDTTTGEKTVNLPKGPDGKNYRIVNIGNADNHVILHPLTGVELIGFTDDEYLSDGEVLILTYQSPVGWF